MTLAEGIRRHGFRKWYERELLQSHAHLALTFICLVGVFAAFEALTRFRSFADQAADLATLLLSAGVGLWALRRYLFLLGHADPRCDLWVSPVRQIPEEPPRIRTEGEGRKNRLAQGETPEGPRRSAMTKGTSGRHDPSRRSLGPKCAAGGAFAAPRAA